MNTQTHKHTDTERGWEGAYKTIRSFKSQPKWKFKNSWFCSKSSRLCIRSSNRYLNPNYIWFSVDGTREILSGRPGMEVAGLGNLHSLSPRFSEYSEFSKSQEGAQTKWVRDIIFPAEGGIGSKFPHFSLVWLYYPADICFITILKILKSTHKAITSFNHVTSRLPTNFSYR